MTTTPEANRGLARRAAALGPWFHNLHLPDGTQTCPDHFLGDFPRYKWEAIAPWLPPDLTGWTVLDIGCNAGFYSFELARRGARVTGLDREPLYLRQARWAADVLGLADRVELRHGSVYDLVRAAERYDLVMFMGVFYHLRYPLLALDAVSRCVGRRLVFQSLELPAPAPSPAGAQRRTNRAGDGALGAEVMADVGIHERHLLQAPDWPKMAFIEGRLQRDPTNWWVASAACTRALLRSAGLYVLGRPTDETWLCAPDTGGPTSHWTWNAAEFEAARGGSCGSPVAASTNTGDPS